MLVVGGVGLFCGRVHLQTRETKGNQGKPRETKGNQGKPKGNQGKPKGTQGKPRKTQGKPKENQGKPRKTPSINKRNTFQSMGVSLINRIPF
jgi:hypothetical protein